MANPPLRILFVSHSASRNGATILLLHLLRWLKPRVDWEMEVLVDGGGPLVDEFRAIARTTVLRNTAAPLGMVPRAWRAGLKTFIDTQYIRTLLRGRGFDLIYANTAAAWPHVVMLRKRAPALLWHIHELGYGLRLSIGEGGASRVLRLASRFVAVSNAVHSTLTGDFQVPDNKVDLVHGCIPLPYLSPEERLSRRQRAREALGWPPEAFVVGGCGTLGWRKGTDLFLQVAHAVSRTASGGNIRFLWVGGEAQGQGSLEFAYDLRALGIQERCRRIPARADVSDFYCAMDVFALTSREDPFPLVMLEAAAHSLPVVCFAGTGGGPEFTGDDAGLIAPYLAIDAFAEHILTLQGTPALRQRLGMAASRKVQTHYGMERQWPKLLQSIELCLQGADRRHATKATPADSNDQIAISQGLERM